MASFPLLFPPAAYKLRLSFNDLNDHRFKVEIVSAAGQSRCGRNSYSRGFASVKSSWKDALKEAHRWMWSRWMESPEAAAHGGASQQVPGQVAEDVLNALSPVIEELPGPKVYK